MRIDEDFTSAEMERLRVRRLRRAFAGGADPNGPRSMLGRGLLASVILAVLLVGGVFAAGVIEASGSNLEGSSEAVAAPATTVAPTPSAPSTQPEAPPTTQPAPPPTTEAPTTQPSAPPPAEQVGIAVSATEWWTDTGVDVSEGDVVQVDATGTITAAVGDPRTEVGPDGSPNPEFASANRNEHGVQVGGGHGALIGTLSRDRPPFLVGASNTIEVERDGHLFLSVNDGGLDNNAGQFDVTLTIQRAAGS
jgi:hypothetical protein